MKLHRNHFIAIVVAVVVILGLVVIFNYSCGQSPSGVETTTTTTSTTTTTAVQGATISGVVMVPASSVAGAFRVSSVRAAETADDGVSDTPLGGATVVAVDPVTNAQLSGFSATTDDDGVFTGTAANLPPGEVLFRATKSRNGATVMVETLSATNTVISVNAGSTLATTRLMEEVLKKTADLPAKATSLSDAEKEQLRSQMEAMFSGIRSGIGAISPSNAPNLAVSGLSGLSGAALQQRFNQALSGIAAVEFTPPSNWSQQTSGLYDAATALVNTGQYSSGLTMPTDAFPSFAPPPSFPFPSGVIFEEPRNDVSFASFAATYFSGIKNEMRNLSGVTFYCPLPDILAGLLPSGAVFGNASFVGSDWAGSGKLPPSAIFSGIPPSALPSGMYLSPGSDFTDISSDQKIIPSGLNLDSGFLVSTDWRFGADYSLPADISFQSGYVMPSGMRFEAGFTFQSGMLFDPSFVMPASGVSYGSGFNPSGKVSFFESGWQRPSGWTPPSGWQDPSGYQPPPSGQSTTTTTFHFTPPPTYQVTTTTYPHY
ncbi:MAG: carboxypeptidase-like regulatory domain-containing protein [Candidatus Margulisbacteria bacterium]|nr:carboxypeptidase-like regulatory domain-containing protein [Candidatus Margulisiibacteriota bacterium]